MKYRKMPVVIEAVTWHGKYSDGSEWPRWFRDAVDDGTISFMTDPRLAIKTLEGTIYASSGDKVIRGVKGEIYPCKPDIFAATYEPVE